MQSGTKDTLKMLKIVAFVHAKSSSTRLKNKNMRLLGGIPLFCHVIRSSLQSKMVTKVIIDSDSEEILKIGEEYGAIPLKRPIALASNSATGDDLMYWQASNYAETDIVLQVIPTSPFIMSISIDEAIKKLLKKKVDSVVGVRAEALYTWIAGAPAYFKADGTIPNSFELEKTVYETTGLYVNRTEFVLNRKKRLNPERCSFYELSKIESIDINDEEDFRFAEIVWKGLQKAKQF